VDRLDARLNELVASDDSVHSRPTAATSTTTSTADGNVAPVFLLRDAATDAGVHSPDSIQIPSDSNVISSGLVSLPTANSLLELYVSIAVISFAHYD
jgi:hypothetical protein